MKLSSRRRGPVAAAKGTSSRAALAWCHVNHPPRCLLTWTRCGAGRPWGRIAVAGAGSSWMHLHLWMCMKSHVGSCALGFTGGCHWRNALKQKHDKTRQSAGWQGICRLCSRRLLLLGSGPHAPTSTQIHIVARATAYMHEV